MARILRAEAEARCLITGTRSVRLSASSRTAAPPGVGHGNSGTSAMHLNASRCCRSPGAGRAQKTSPAAFQEA